MSYIFCFVSLLLLIWINTNAIVPVKTIKTDGYVFDYVFESGLVYAATSNGKVQKVNIKTSTVSDFITLSKIEDFVGEQIPQKVFDIDKLENFEKLLLVAQGKHSFRNLYIYSNTELVKIFDAETDKLPIKRAYFLNENEIVIGLYSNEIIRYNYSSKEIVYRKSFGTASLSDLDVNLQSNELYFSDEGGRVGVVNAINGKLIKFQNFHQDNIYSIAVGKNSIIAGGQDQKVSIYDVNRNKVKSFKTSFLVYCVGISANDELAAYSFNESCDISILDLQSFRKLEVLKGHYSIVTKIHFVSNNKIITSAEEEQILIWEL